VRARRVAEHLDELAALRPKIVYTDLDGTILGPGGSLFASPDGGITRAAAEAVAALHSAGIGLVPVSGRAEVRVREAARLLGAAGFIAELGGITARGNEVVRDYGAHRGRGTPAEAMARTGAAAFLLETCAGRLEPHAPWAHDGREVSMLFRGHVEVGEAHADLDEAGYGWVRLHDNGIVPRSFPGLDVSEVHVYNLLPEGVTKATAVAADLVARGLEGREAIALGDSTSDLGLAPHVAAVFIVANGMPAVERADHVPESVYVTDAGYGDGFAEAVDAVLA
jgi:hydroxymethylpyrimidine pyrophosphatase-like HAD family hydrolase